MLRAEDTLARLGGDEFVLLLRDIDPGRGLCGDRPGLAAVSAPMLVDGTPVSVSASIGVTLYPLDNADSDTLLRHADQAMYRAKEAGKNRYHLFDPEHDRKVQAQTSRCYVWRMPCMAASWCCSTSPRLIWSAAKVPGAEALIRWQNPEEGFLLPGAFLHYLEGSDLEIAIGDWVIESVLRQMESWQAIGLRLVVGANIGANHLLQPEFTEHLRQALERHPLVPPGNLELEVLESAALSDMERAVHTLAACRQLGVRFALDDFGTGYSSLSYFRNLPVDVLKIDQSFVLDMLDDPSDLGIVESVVRLAHAFNRPVIAEGVETLEHGALLVRIGAGSARVSASPVPCCRSTCRHGSNNGTARPSGRH